MGESSKTSIEITPSKVALKDTIFALGKPDPEFAKHIQNEHAVLFLGKLNTYLLVEGGEKLMQIARELDPISVSFGADNEQCFIKEKMVWGKLLLNYGRGRVSSMKLDEQQKLDRLGFKLHRDVYLLPVDFSGAIYPPLDLSRSNYSHLQLPREIVFRTPTTTEHKTNTGKLALLPATIVIDVLTAPFQLLGLLMLKIQFRNKPFSPL